MLKIKYLDQIRQNLINNIHDALPLADTKEGTFIRDVFINPTSDEFAAMYIDMKSVELAQSVLTASGRDLDRLASNYFIERKPATHSSGKLRFFIKNSDKKHLDIEKYPKTMVIKSGTKVSTIETFFQEQIDFITEATVIVHRDEIVSLPILGLNGLRYIEIPAVSISPGEIANVDAGEITNLLNNFDISEFITTISNPFAFTGGSNRENDNSLMLRISLAVSGANIGTKDGYLNYVLKQSGVIGAKVVGAGDESMIRDGGHFENGKYIPGTGGKVDIYIKGSINTEYIDEYAVSINGNIREIPLTKQPVNSVSSITSVPKQDSEYSDPITYDNADNYDTEKIIDSDKNAFIIKEYCHDVIWDFGIKDSFPINDPYGQPLGTAESVANLKEKIDSELQKLSKDMMSIHSKIDWKSEGWIEDDDERSIFDRYVTHDGERERICKLRIKGNVFDDNPNDRRMFIKKGDVIYVRKYVNPDYRLVPGFENEAEKNSVLSKYKIEWLEKADRSKIHGGDTLKITYNYDKLIEDLQNDIEKVKVLTADVLIKQAIEVPIEIIIKATCTENNNPSSVRKNIQNDIMAFIDTVKKIGGKFDRSDIITIARSAEGVYSVNVDSVKVRKIDDFNININANNDRIETNDDEYLSLKNENLIIDVIME